MKTLRSPGYEFGPYRLDTVGRSLKCRGEVIALPPKAVEVLAELVKRPGEVVGKKELLETVWPEAFVEEANLNQMVFVLRRAIESTNGSEYITTVPRRGYQFRGTVRRVEIPMPIQRQGRANRTNCSCLATSCLAHVGDAASDLRQFGNQSFSDSVLTLLLSFR